MEGKIYRVTYNTIRHTAELHMKDGEVKVIPMTDDEWQKMLDGDLVENFNKLLNEE